MVAAEHREQLREAIERARARAQAARETSDELIETPRDVMEKRLVDQWQKVIGPVLHALREELLAAGHVVSITEPGESMQGMFRIDSNKDETHWYPAITFSPAQDGRAVEVTSMAGETASNPPVVALRDPNDLTADYITSVVVRLVDVGL